MNLLNINDLNNFHITIITYFRFIINDIEIITNSTIIDKISFIECVVQSFFYNFNSDFENVKMFFLFNFIFNVVMNKFVAVKKTTISIITEKIC